MDNNRLKKIVFPAGAGAFGREGQEALGRERVEGPIRASTSCHPGRSGGVRDDGEVEVPAQRTHTFKAARWEPERATSRRRTGDDDDGPLCGALAHG